MDLATGALGSLLDKLVELVQKEYNLQTAVRKDVESLAMELRTVEAALSKVAEVPRYQLDKQVRLWADQVRVLSYEMEDVVDGFMVHVEGSDPGADMKRSKRFSKNITKVFNNAKTRHQIADEIKEIKARLKEVADLRDRYKVNYVPANPAVSTSNDLRMLALFKDQRELVGIDEPRDDLIKKLIHGDDGVSKLQLKILSIFGSGGLGKTTLAKAAYDKLQPEFVLKAFVSVGQNPNLKKVFMDILQQLDERSCLNATMLDQWQLLTKLQVLLKNKRYLIVIDDIWDESSWETIRCACIDSNCGSRIITTTRIFKVAKAAGDVYKQQPLSPRRSKELFYARLSLGKCKNSCDESVEISEKVLQKCGGVPLAIITIASLLASKPRENWSEVYDSIGFGYSDNIHVDNTRKILQYSYYDLPCHLRTCLLYLSIYPEDYEIEKKTLIWKWVAEGFVHEEPRTRLFEVGERYFDELINRSMIQPVENIQEGIIYACRVHDLVLDMIYSLSKEENFVVVLGSNQQNKYQESNARWLAIQKRVTEQDPMANTVMAQVRSLNATMCHLSTMPSLSSFQVLRVLALEECTFMGGRPCNLEHLGRLLQLRYLKVSFTPVTELPSEIGNLKYLQTLDLKETGIEKLPQGVGLLRQLKCLHLDIPKGVCDWIGKLTSLEELWLSHVSLDFVKELGKLTELRELKVMFANSDDNKLLNDFMESLGNLQKLQVIQVFSQSSCIEWVDCEGYVAPRHLHDLALGATVFPRLPPWIDSSRLPNLSHLRLNMKTVEARDVEILGRFPELITLELTTGDDFFPDVVGGGAFPRLRYFYTDAMLRFLQGAMPSLEFLDYFVGWQACKAASLDHDFASMENLPCLEKVRVYMHGARTELKEAESALRHAVEIHPKRPTLELLGHLQWSDIAFSLESLPRIFVELGKRKRR